MPAIHIIVDTLEKVILPPTEHLPRGVHVAVVKLSDMELDESDVDTLIKPMLTTLVTALRGADAPQEAPVAQG